MCGYKSNGVTVVAVERDVSTARLLRTVRALENRVARLERALGIGSEKKGKAK